ncbi:MAG: 4Fe-4S binding protein [Gracilibacteraceae bacterium]|jgi:ferredoxin|nr:4Fe-4S binding protein [Gracilibacteraceae bacterium]
MSKLVARVAISCVACGCCEAICPQKAVAVYKGVRAVVNEEKCVGCGKCAKTCPAVAISVVERRAAE